MTRKLKKVTSCIVLLLVLFLSAGVFPALGVENEAVEPLGMPLYIKFTKIISIWGRGSYSRLVVENIFYAS